MYKVALDAGHGLKTSGKRCLKSLDPDETREFALNNRIYKHVAAMLGAYDEIRFFPVHDVTGASDVPLYNRTKKANEIGADIYISIHHNAGLNGKKGGGIVAYCHNYGSVQSFKLRDIAYKSLIKETGLSGNRSTPKNTANFQVLRDTHMPAILIECGFMDSPDDVPVILSDKFARQAAEGFISAILEYFMISKIEKPLEVGEKELTEKEVRNIVEEEVRKIIVGSGDPSKWAEKSWIAGINSGVTDGSRPTGYATRQEVMCYLDRLGLLK